MSKILSSDRRRFLMGAAGTAGAMMLASKASADHHEAANPHLPPPPENGQTMTLADGTELYYVDTGGDGEVVVLLHSMTGSARVWEYQMPVLLERGYRVIAYSRRGHWGSSRIDPDNPGNGVSDLEGLLEGLGVEKFHGMGTAGGGYYLMDYAVKNHAKMHSMMLACSILAINEPDFQEILRRPRFSPEAFPHLTSAQLETSANYRASNPEGLARWEALEHVARYDNSIMQPLVHGVTWEEVAQITCPVMLVAGGTDTVTPYLMDYTAPKYQNAVSHVINNVGHSAYWEDPMTFNTLMLNFFAQHGAQA